MDASQLIVNEPKVKVDLKQYTERHTFHFDAVFAEDVDNEAVYRRVQLCPACSFCSGAGCPETGPRMQENRAASAYAMPKRGESNMLCIWADRQRQDIHHAGDANSCFSSVGSLWVPSAHGLTRSAA